MTGKRKRERWPDEVQKWEREKSRICCSGRPYPDRRHRFQSPHIFCLSLNFAATSGGINVRLPKAATAEPIKAEQLTISLTRDDKLYLNDKTISLDELSKTLERNQNKESLVIIRADNAVPHGRVVEVMDMAKTHGFSRLAIGVEQAPPERK